MLNKFIALIITCISFIFFINFAQAEEIPILANFKISESYSQITGTTTINNNVLIYLDGKFVDYAKIVRGNDNQANFIYDIPLNLAQGSPHNIIGIAQDRTSLLLSAPTKELSFKITSLPAPKLTYPQDNLILGVNKPLISGTTISGTILKIYFDGVLNGDIKSVNNTDGTASFIYSPFLNFSPGWHQVWAIAEKNGNISEKSAIISFKVELPMPAPTILKLAASSQNINHPLLTGLAKNGSRVQVYVDKKYDGELIVKENKSGTANFSYKIKETLTKSQHSVYTTAIDSKGKVSRQSNVLSFMAKLPSIAQGQQEERQEAVARIEEVKPIEKDKSAAISDKDGTIETKTNEPNINVNENKQIFDDEIKNILGQQEKNSLEQTGIVNESEQSQSKLKLNLIIFIIFLVGIIGWMLWVNRELIKERRQQDQNKLDK